MADEKTKAVIKDNKPLNFWKSFTDFVEETNRVSRLDEKALISQSGSSVSIKNDGRISLSAGSNAQKKMPASGNFSEISYSNSIKTNRMKMEADDIILNNHKLNNKLYELADYKRVLDQEGSRTSGIAGGLTMLGTVLTRSWDPNLKKYVMIRRLVNIPVFSPSLGIPEVHPGLKIPSCIEKINDMQKLLSSGSQAFSAVANSLRKTAEQIKEEITQEEVSSQQAGETIKYGEDTKNA